MNGNGIIRFRTLSALLLTFISLSLQAQDGRTLWLFGKKYTPEFEQQWKSGHIIRATACGDGTITACDAEGRPLERYDVVKNRPEAGPFKAGDAFVFEVTADGLQAGTYIDFDATFTIEDGAPMDWAVEILDGGEWRTGRTFRCHGPAFGGDHKYTSAYCTFRLEDAVTDGKICIRLRALEGEARKGTDGDAGVLLVPEAYVGALVRNLGQEPPEDTLKVLCIGNSFTYYCGTPVLLKEIAWAEGHYADVSASLKGGRTMAQHLSLEMTDDLVAEGGYDYVILQDQSQAAAKVGRDRREHRQLVRDIADMASKVRAESDGCKAIVEWTWAYEGKEYGGFGSLEAFDRYGRKGAKIMARAVGDAEVSPIAEAFRIVREERPDIDLYHTDRHHQSFYGSYLKSCVNYLMLYREPFGDAPEDCTVDPETAEYLRNIAERVVLRRK